MYSVMREWSGEKPSFHLLLNVTPVIQAHLRGTKPGSTCRVNQQPNFIGEEGLSGAVLSAIHAFGTYPDMRS